MPAWGPRDNNSCAGALRAILCESTEGDDNATVRRCDGATICVSGQEYFAI